jgi:hypothetical protein
MGSGGIAPPILTSALGEERSVSLPYHFTPGEVAPLYPLDRRMSGPQELVWTTWRIEKSFSYRASNSNALGRPARTQSLYRLRYPGC